jgi:hypothetical protein
MIIQSTLLIRFSAFFKSGMLNSLNTNCDSLYGVQNTAAIARSLFLCKNSA